MWTSAAGLVLVLETHRPRKALLEHPYLYGESAEVGWLSAGSFAGWLGRATVQAGVHCGAPLQFSPLPCPAPQR